MERWKPIPDFPNYEISDQGRIRNKNTKQIMRQKVDRGYRRVTLFRDGVKCSKLIHRLVVDSFMLNPDGKKEINHIDGDKNNNGLSNLEWCTRSENMKHAYRTGLKQHSGGTPERAVRIIESGDVYPSAHECARQLGLDPGHINHCLTGKRKSHKGHHFEYA